MPGPGISKMQSYYDLVEQVIATLGAPVEECRTVENGQAVPGQWNLMKGSANVFVDVYTPSDGLAYCCVASPIMEVVTGKLKELYEKLLILNHQMYAASFSINEGWIWLRIVRECEGMDANECRAMFDRVGWYADQYDDDLKAEFGS
jgi:hypothetical protein